MSKWTGSTWIGLSGLFQNSSDASRQYCEGTMGKTGVGDVFTKPVEPLLVLRARRTLERPLKFGDTEQIAAIAILEYWEHGNLCAIFRIGWMMTFDV